VFARAAVGAALTGARFRAAGFYAATGRIRVSSGLYLLKDGGWMVFQPPQQPPND